VFRIIHGCMCVCVCARARACVRVCVISVRVMCVWLRMRVFARAASSRVTSLSTTSKRSCTSWRFLAPATDKISRSIFSRHSPSGSRSDTCVPTHVHTRVYAHAHSLTHARTHARTHAHTHTRTRAHTHARTRMRTHARCACLCEGRCVARTGGGGGGGGAGGGGGEPTLISAGMCSRCQTRVTCAAVLLRLPARRREPMGMSGEPIIPAHQ